MKYVVLIALSFAASGCLAEAAPADSAAERAQPLERSRYAIGGMTCVSCANSIRAELMRQPGVQLATVLFSDEALVIDWKPGERVDHAMVVERVEGLGYTAELERTPPEE